jgi:hypothetical protein
LFLGLFNVIISSSLPLTKFFHKLLSSPVLLKIYSFVILSIQLILIILLWHKAERNIADSLQFLDLPENVDAGFLTTQIHPSARIQADAFTRANNKKKQKNRSLKHYTDDYSDAPLCTRT